MNTLRNGNLSAAQKHSRVRGVQDWDAYILYQDGQDYQISREPRKAHTND